MNWFARNFLKAFALFVAGGIHALGAEPRGDSNVRTIRLIEVPGTATGSDAKAAIVADESVYLAGETWTNETGDESWLWRLDSAGAKLWQKRLPITMDRRMECAVVALLPRASGGVRVFATYGGDTHAFDFTPDGEVARKAIFAAIDDYPAGVLALDDGDVLLFGNDSTASHAWVARTDPAGALRWKQTFNPGKDDLLMAAALLPDGSIALLGETGEYNKFGQGPSKLWLLRIRGGGGKVCEAFIEDARVFPTGRDMIAAIGNELLVPFTRSQLPPIGNIPIDEPFAFDARIARFDANLKQRWDKPAPPTSMPGATTLSAQLVSMAAGEDDLLICGLDENAKELWGARVTADGSIHPLAVVRLGEDVIGISNYWQHQDAPEKQRKQVMLVFIKQPNAVK